MGQASSLDDPKLQAVVQKLSKLEVKDLEAVFLELSTQSDGGQSVIRQPTWLNRDKFAEVFGTNELVVEQLFEAFDKDKNGLVDMQEFISGMALCLHGSIKDKCSLLFKVFNLDGDNGVSPDELSTILTSCLQSAHSLLRQTLKSERLSFSEEELNDQTGEAMMVSVVVDKLVKDAFNKCDVSGNGKLEVDEFTRWIYKNPKLVNNLFVLQCPKPSKPSMSSQYSVIQDINEGNSVSQEESLEGDVFDDPYEEIESLTDQPEQLSMEDTTNDKTTTKLQSLFGQQSGTGSGDESFFDTLGSSNPSQEVSLPRPQSDQCLSQHFQESTQLHAGTSETNISSLPPSKHLLHLDNTSDSLQSIALSRDSLLTEDINHETASSSEQATYSHEGIIELNQPDVSQSTETNNISKEEGDILNKAPKTENDILNIGEQEERDDLNNDTEEEGDDKLWHPLQTPRSDTAYESIEDEEENKTPADNVNKQQQEESSGYIDNLGDKNIEVAVEASPIELDVSMNDSTRRMVSYWQPSHTTEQQLHMASLGNTIDQKYLTYPSVLIEGLMGDPIKDLVTKYLGEQEASKRLFPTPDSVEMNENGLKQLLNAGCWRGAIDFTAKYLSAHGQGLNESQITSSPLKRSMMTPSLIQIWFVRIALLVKMRMFSLAEAELNAFNEFDGPDLYYEFYPHLYAGKKGNIVPFSFRLLFAELPQHNGRPNLALDRLYTLQRKVQRVILNLSQGLMEDGSKNENLNEEELKESCELWNLRMVRLQYSLGNCFLGMKEYNLAAKLFESIIVLEPKKKVSIVSAIGRIYLQLGDIKTASKYFTQLESITEEDTKLESIKAMNSGYLELAKSNYDVSYKNFMTSLQLDPQNIACCNNAAVCLLFLGRVKEASNILERMVWESPLRSLHEDILFNLNTVYELETSRTLQKKYKLLDLVSMNKGDGFFTQCLKLS